jgi:hypothetical protein
MPGRNVGLALVVLLAAGCAAAPVGARFQPGRPADPDRFERAACLRGDYPAEVDERAYAQARTVDRHAERNNLVPPNATGRLLAQRATFDARCSGWRDQSGTGVVMAGNPAAPFVSAGLQLQ